MAIINIVEPITQKIIVNQTENTDDIRASTVSITDNFTNTVSIVSIERGIQGPPGSGLPGPQGPKGDTGIGITGPVGPSGEQGPPGSGISVLRISDLINTIALSGTESSFTLSGQSGTSVLVDNNNKSITISSPNTVGVYAPISHSHTASNIVNLSESIDDRVYDLLKTGNNISLNYRDQDFNDLLISVTGLTIGDDVQAHDALLDNLSSLSVYSGAMLYGNGTGGFNLIQATTQATRLLNDASAADQRNTLGLGSISTYDSSDFAKIVGGNSFTGTQSLGDGELNRFSASINYQTTDSYTVQQSDNGKIIALQDNDSPINVSFNNSINNGFNCLVVQLGSGQVRFSGSIYNRYDHSKLVGQYSIATIIKIASNVLILSGDTTALNSGP